MVPENFQCRSRGCPHIATKGKDKYCPVHCKKWYPLLGHRGCDFLGHAFLSWGRKKGPVCDCSSPSCISAGYFPGQHALFIPKAGHETCIKTPHLLSSDKRAKLLAGKGKELRLYAWHFLPNHREKGKDGKWRLSYSKKAKATFCNLERRKYSFPPPLHPPSLR